ncbi:hypothetical protein C6570_10535 [Ottowia oryzae]|uniref:Uncharacterized protein n=1 Tax=Ottowia oryzae TaxID=2109914 RepID=A0A2S0MFS5_9BURK|nr:hypothetical protein C6570_10535 [Ottowia oryzae]
MRTLCRPGQKFILLGLQEVLFRDIKVTCQRNIEILRETFERFRHSKIATLRQGIMVMAESI